VVLADSRVVSTTPLTRRRSIWELHDFGTGRGLEIGPLHRTIVRRDQADVRYVDVLDREGLVAHYADDAGVDTDRIPEIDFPLIQPDGRALGLAEAAAPGAPYDWVMASHVVEHVPDLIGWLADLAELTTDGAALVLVVPDRRYTFDALRPPTTVGQLVQAHLDGDTRPSVRAVYDYVSGAIDYDRPALWRGEVPDYASRLYSLEHTAAKLDETLSGAYVDAHVWLFTPQSLTEQLHELRVSGRSAWALTKLTQTPALEGEFMAVLTRLPRASDLTADQAEEVLASSTRPDWLTPVEPDSVVVGLEERVATLEARLERNRNKLREVQARQRERRERDQRRIADLEAEVAELRGRRS
jgi:hypothetical protein